MRTYLWCLWRYYRLQLRVKHNWSAPASQMDCTNLNRNRMNIYRKTYNQTKVLHTTKRKFYTMRKFKATVTIYPGMVVYMSHLNVVSEKLYRSDMMATWPSVCGTITLCRKCICTTNATLQMGFHSCSQYLPGIAKHNPNAGTDFAFSWIKRCILYLWFYNNIEKMMKYKVLFKRLPLISTRSSGILSVVFFGSKCLCSSSHSRKSVLIIYM